MTFTRLANLLASALCALSQSDEGSMCPFQKEIDSDEFNMIQEAKCDVVDELTMIQEASEVQVLPGRKRASFLAAHDSLSVDEGDHMKLGSQSMRVSLKRHRAKVSETMQSGTQVRHKTSYFGLVYVGNPRQAFVVVFDTGSGNLVLPGSDCQDPACRMHHRYDPSSSHTRKGAACDGSGQNYQYDDVKITFGTGTIQGVCHNDEICISGVCSRGDFIAATHETDMPFAQFHFDGVMGMSMPSLAQGTQFNLMNHMAKFLKKPIFSFYMSDSDYEESQVVFGDAPEELMAEDKTIHWARVTHATGYWEVTIEDVTLGNKKAHVAPEYGVAVDTGTSELAGPSHVIDELAYRLNVRPDCSNFDTLDDLGFIIGDEKKHVFNLAPEDYIDRQYGQCRLAFMKLDVPPPKGPLFILGVPFLQKFVTVYDSAQKRVGFALAKHGVRTYTLGRQPIVEM